MLEASALGVVLGLAFASWLLVHGLATAVYRHFGSHGSPPLALIRGPGPDPGPTGEQAAPWSATAGRSRRFDEAADLWRDDLPPSLQADSFIVRLLATPAGPEVAVR